MLGLKTLSIACGMWQEQFVAQKAFFCTENWGRESGFLWHP